MNIIKFFHIIHNLYFKQKYFIKRKYYSSEGEDLFLKKKLDLKKKGFYVDVGAYHPIRHNNTMILYQNGWRGINIDANQFSIDLFNFIRPEDENFNIAISDKSEKIDFYSSKKHDPQSTANKITPVMITGMFLFFPLPAGVLLYMVIANIFQAFQTFLLSQEALPDNLQNQLMW